MRPHLLVIVFTLAFVSGYPQRLEPGYIVESKGDTIKGFIPERTLIDGYGVCKFTTDPKQPLKKYYPTEILAFGGATGTYVVQWAIAKEKKRVFAKELISGPLRLFKYSNRTFGIKSDSTDTVRILGNKNYLRFYAKNCPEIQKTISKVHNEEDSQLRFFSRLYDCLDTPYKLNLRPLQPGYTLYYVNVGYGASMISYQSNARAFSNVSFNTAVSPVFGVAAERYRATRRRQNFAFFFDLNINKSLLQGKANEQSGTDFNLENVVIDFYGINLSVTAKKDIYQKGNTVLSIGAGAVAQYNIVKKTLWMQDYTSGDAITTRTNDFHYPESTWGATAMFGIKQFVGQRPFSLNIRGSYLIGDRFKVMSYSAMAGFGINKRKPK